MKKSETFGVKISTVSSKETFLVYPSLTYFNQRNRRTHDATDLLALSLVNVIVYIVILLEKSFIVHI